MLKTFGKLLKYDIRAGAKTYSLVYIVLAVLAAITALSCLVDITLVNGFVSTTAILGSVACAVVIIVASIKQVYAQICGRESYLTYTLPVGTASIVLSKAINIIMWVILAVAGLALYWVMYYKIGPADIKETIDMLIASITEGGEVGSLLLVAVTMSIISSVFLLILCAGIANLPQLKNRNAGVPIAVVAWYGISQVIGFVFVGVWFVYIILNGGEISNEYLNNPETSGFLGALSNIMLIGYAVATALFFAISVKLIGKKRSV